MLLIALAALGLELGRGGGEMGAVCYRCRTGASVGTRLRAPARCWGLGLSLGGVKAGGCPPAGCRHRHRLAEGCWGAADLLKFPRVRQKSPKNRSLNGQSTPGTRNTRAGVELGAGTKQAGGSSAVPCSLFFVSLHHFSWVCAFCSPPDLPKIQGTSAAQAIRIPLPCP